MLRSEYSANIKLPDSPGPERIFSVSAADADTVADVIGKLSLFNLLLLRLKGM